jgi:hypothetical protein
MIGIRSRTAASMASTLWPTPCGPHNPAHHGAGSVAKANRWRTVDRAACGQNPDAAPVITTVRPEMVLRLDLLIETPRVGYG